MAKTPHYKEYHHDCGIFVHPVVLVVVLVVVVVGEVHLVHFPCYWEKNLAFDSFPGPALGFGCVFLFLLGHCLLGFHSFLK